MPKLYLSPDGSEVYLCPTTGGLSDKGPRSARRAEFSQVAHFSNVSIPRQIAALEQHTRELKALSIEIRDLTKQAEGWLRI